MRHEVFQIKAVLTEFAILPLLLLNQFSSCKIAQNGLKYAVLFWEDLPISIEILTITVFLYLEFKRFSYCWMNFKDFIFYFIMIMKRWMHGFTGSETGMQSELQGRRHLLLWLWKHWTPSPCDMTTPLHEMPWKWKVYQKMYYSISFLPVIPTTHIFNIYKYICT